MPKRNNMPHRRTQRQADAIVRQAAWDYLTDEERLDRVMARVGAAPEAWVASNEARKIKAGAYQ